MIQVNDPGNSARPDADDRERRIERVLAAYLEAVEQGNAPDPLAWLKEHADLADELGDFLSACASVGRTATGPTRTHVAPNLVFEGSRPFGGYRLLRVLGRGGMGVVYEAKQAQPDRTVAIKVMHPTRELDVVDRQRFRNEAEASAWLNHPGIVPIYEVGEHEDHLYFSMRLIEGGSLAGRAGRPSVPREAATLIAAVARAVHHAHQRGILHRDLKPSNVLVDSAGLPYVADFGLAKQLHLDSDLTQTGAMIGTPAYMAPELAANAPRSHASREIRRARQATTAIDVYGLGAVLYFLLTGKAPFRGETPLDTLAQVVGKEPIPPGRLTSMVDRDLEAICLKCLDKEPARRFGSAAEVADDLDRWLAGLPTRARPLRRFHHAVRWCRRNPVVASLSLLLCVAVVLGTGAVVAERLAVRDARRDAGILERTSETRAEQLRVREYPSLIGAAYQHWLRAEPNEARDLLERAAPPDGGRDLRGFEWSYLWNLQSDRRGEPIVLAGHSNIVYHVALSPDGTRIASGGADSRIRMWNPATGACTSVLDPPHAGDVNWLGFSPDGSRLVSCGEDTAIRVWDAASGRPLFGWKHPTRTVECAVFSPDSAHIATGGVDGVVRLWNVETRDIEQAWPTHSTIPAHGAISPAGIEMLAFSPDGQWLASAGHDHRVVIHDLATRAVRAAIGLDAAALAVAFSSDSRRVAVGTRGGSVSVWSVDGSNVWWEWRHRHAVRDVRFLRQGDQELVFSCGEDGTLRRWDANDGRDHETLVNGQCQFWAIGGAPDKPFCVTAGHDHMVRIWNLDRFQDRQILPDREAWRAAACACYTPDGRRLLVGDASGRIGIWDVDDARWIAECSAGQDGLCSLGVSPDGSRFVSSSPTGPAVIWNLGDGRSPEPGPEDRVLTGVGGRIAWIGDERIVYATPDEVVLLEYAANRIVQRTPNRPDATWLATDTLAVSPDASRVAIGRTDHSIWLVDPRSGVERLIRGAHSRPIVRLAFSPDGALLASSSADRSVRQWHVADDLDNRAMVDAGSAGAGGVGAVVGALVESVELGPLAFSRDGRTLVVGGADGIVRWIHVATGTKMLEFALQPGPVLDLLFAPNGEQLVAVGGDDSRNAARVVLWHASPPALK
ncbi:MAG: hypothetical protein FJ297_17775 [Planctomycetes bacterium]|nr:hypothetical protein [Planctomycetota bacterium]